MLCPRGVNLHYEVELAAVMGREADNLTPENALDAVKGWCVGIDMTARNCMPPFSLSVCVYVWGCVCV